jgi:type IV secretion system protein VirD4
VRDIISRSDIDLTAPGKRKCAYFVILSDQDATMAFLSSLFFSFLFIKIACRICLYRPATFLPCHHQAG